MAHAGTIAHRTPEHTDYASGWSGKLLHLLVASGAVTVIAGSYMTWATFYGGLIARTGVAGHGRYFIGLAIAAILASMVAGKSGVWRGLRWLPAAAGAAILFVAYRDLRNLDALIADPASGFYLPGRGDGLTVVIIGAVILMAAPIAFRAIEPSRPARVLPTFAAIAAVIAVALMAPGIYGVYFDVTNPSAIASESYGRDAQLMVLGGTVSALVAVQLTLMNIVRRRSGASPAVSA